MLHFNVILKMAQQLSLQMEESHTKKTLFVGIFLAFGAYILYHRIMGSPVMPTTETNDKKDSKKIKTKAFIENSDPTSGDCSTATQGGCSISSTADSNDIKRDRPISKNQSAVVSQYLNCSLQKNI
ncbi:Hypothetical protein SRAE_2000355200 [Strongyloides ratti]|uniref:Uncharacterized protein n=1 Tax=Strongyloides ratti TaxID=34506 RepID=A0A090LL46_STRRB|nr:Hypothetical protein SRAE_2000355200 [Strongyloides ratti]CEF68898.1 Hypothetical protein SRAE_2000355200 [Strongyloides ratti]